MQGAYTWIMQAWRQPLLSVLASLALPTGTAAHHSFAAAFDLKSFIEVEGEVGELAWVNPHVGFRIRDASGTVWRVEAGPIELLRRMGIEQETLHAGARMRVRGNPARGRPQHLWLTHLRLSDGTEILATPTAEAPLRK